MNFITVKGTKWSIIISLTCWFSSGDTESYEGGGISSSKSYTKNVNV